MRRFTLPVLLLSFLGAAPAVRAQTYNLTGFVKDPRGAGIAGVTIDLYDPVANSKATAVQNTTLANGQFNAFFTPTNPAATQFYVDYTPVAGTGHAAIQSKDHAFTSTTVALPDMILPDAVVLTVNCFDTAGAAPQTGVQVEVYDDPTTSKMYTPGSTTPASGQVAIDLPPGVYDVLATPVRTGPYGVAEAYAYRLTAAATLNLNLPGGSNVTGSVTDSTGAAVNRAAITVTDPLTGRYVATRYTTTATGTFGFFLANGTYDFLFEPPAGLDLEPVYLPAVVVPGAALNVVLPAAPAMTGTVVDSGGAPQWEAHFKVADSVTGISVSVYRARVDTLGNFHFGLPANGVYDITADPPPGTALLAKTLPHVAVGTAPVNLGTIVLDAGFVVTGHVTGGGQPVTNVNVNAFDSRTGLQYATSRDHTDLNGNFRSVVPPSTWDLEFLPPVATGWLGQRRDAVTVSADLVLTPDVVLVAGADVTATVVGQGAGPLEGASLHFLDPLTGLDATVPHHVTCSLGTVDMPIAAGTYTLHVLPPVGSSWLPLEQAGIVIAAPATSLGTLTLAAGALLQGNVKTAATPQVPVADVNMNAFLPGTSTQLLTAHDHTDYAGHFLLSIAPGTYDIEALPPLGTRYLAARVAGAAVPAAGTTLPDILLDTGVLLSGHTVDASTVAPVANVFVQLADASTGAPYLTAHDHSAFDGRFEIAVTPGSYTVTAIPAITSPYAVKVVPSGSVTADLDMGNIPLTRGFLVGGSVKNSSAQPVAGVTVTAMVAGTTTPVPLARNVTDAGGIADWMVLPGGTYDLTFTPPNGSPYAPAQLTGVAVTADNHALFAVVLQSFSVTSVTPSAGPAAGGVPVTVNGTGFTGTATVTFGGTPLLNPQVTSLTTITGTLPAHFPGVVSVVVTLGNGSTGTLDRAFTFQGTSPPLLLHVTRVYAGGAPTANIQLDWGTNGQPQYVVFRTLDSITGPSVLLGTPAAPPYVAAGEIGNGRLALYDVE